MGRMKQDILLGDPTSIANALGKHYTGVKKQVLYQISALVMEEANRMIFRAIGFDTTDPEKLVEAKEKLRALDSKQLTEIANTAIKQLLNKKNLYDLLNKASLEKRIIV